MTQNLNRLCLECYAYGNKEVCTCGNKTIEIDELMIPSIIEFNKKGYRTNYCCSGHLFDYDTAKFPTTYVSFDTEGKDFITLEKIADIMIPVLFNHKNFYRKENKSHEGISEDFWVLKYWYDDLIQLELLRRYFLVCGEFKEILSLNIRISEECKYRIQNIIEFQNTQLMLIQRINNFASDLTPLI